MKFPKKITLLMIISHAPIVFYIKKADSYYAVGFLFKISDRITLISGNG